jgi:hypothetical protein
VLDQPARDAQFALGALRDLLEPALLSVIAALRLIVIVRQRGDERVRAIHLIRARPSHEQRIDFALIPAERRSFELGKRVWIRRLEFRW